MDNYNPQFISAKTNYEGPRVQTQVSLKGSDESPLIFLFVNLSSSWEINCMCMIQLRRPTEGKRSRERGVIHSEC